MTDVRRGPTSNSVAPAEIAPSAYVERAITVLSAGCALIALAALADLAVRAAVRLELRWDTFMYHIPFAALRGGLRIPYDMNETMGARYQGFPPLPHLLQGMLWRLTGSINATGVVNYLAFVAFLAYCHIALKARFWLVALIALSAPMVLIHTTVSYVDLFGNSLLAIGISSCLYLYLFPERSSRSVLLWGAAEWWDKLERGQKYCVVDMVPIGILLTGPTMSEYSIVERSREALCPPGTTVLTKDGLQSRNVAGARQVPAPSFNAADVLLEESMRHYQAGRFKECVEAAAQSAKLNPNSAPAFTNIGICSANLQRWDAAIENTRKALRLDPNFRLARNNLAWMQQQIVKVGGAKIN